MEGAKRNMKPDRESPELKMAKLDASQAMYEYLFTEHQPSSTVTPSLPPKVSKS